MPSTFDDQQSSIKTNAWQQVNQQSLWQIHLQDLISFI